MTSSAAGRRPLALVTGASQGLGATLAGFLAAEGYDLIVDARHATRLEKRATEFRARGVEVVAVAGDVTDREHRRRLAAQVRRFGRLDLLVHNASELGTTPFPPLASYPMTTLRHVFETNVVAPLALTQLLKPFLSNAHGTIVTISSDAAVGGYRGWGAYGASKAALDLVARTLAEELGDAGIAVVTVDPGDLRTAMHQRAFPGEDISDRPLPEVTIPFWAWLLHQKPEAVRGHRFRAQAESWEGSPQAWTS
jgi:NAD(P)-dependent dehydrogenase (short-subunit alcohol dehydrogenase family)